MVTFSVKVSLPVFLILLAIAREQRHAIFFFFFLKGKTSINIHAHEFFKPLLISVDIQCPKQFTWPETKRQGDTVFLCRELQSYQGRGSVDPEM